MTDERGFLTAILEHPDDDGCKLAYADWLDEQGDPRGEYLRLMMKVRQERIVTPEQRQRHQELFDSLAELRDQQWQELSAEFAAHGSIPENRERERRIKELERQLRSLSKQ